MCSRRFQPGEDPSSDCENLLWNQWIVCSTITREGGVPIPFDIDITIYPETRLLFNHQSCSNSLSEECSDFHRDFGRVTTTFHISGDRVTEEAQCSGREELYHQVQVSLLLYKDRRLLRGGQPGSGGRDLCWVDQRLSDMLCSWQWLMSGQWWLLLVHASRASWHLHVFLLLLHRLFLHHHRGRAG